MPPPPGLLVSWLLAAAPERAAHFHRTPHTAHRSLPMAERRASLMNPRMEYLLERVDSKFTLVTLAAMRAREINDYYNQLGEGLGKIVPPQVTSVSRKPLSISLEEIEVGKIEAVPLPEEPEEPELSEEEAAAALLAAAEADAPA
jgi:DNA-directed RNA polymerase subunit omega